MCSTTGWLINTHDGRCERVEMAPSIERRLMEAVNSVGADRIELTGMSASEGDVGR